ncbi:MAG: hypothetical protein ABR521_10470 [Gaiellaceae bacterium]
MRLFLAGLVLIAAACGGAASRSPPGPPPLARIPASQVKTEITGASAGHRAILLKVLAGIGPTRIRAIEVSTPTEASRRVRRGEVTFRIRTTSDSGELRTAWEAWLLSEAFNRLAYERGLPGVAYVDHPGGGEAIGGWDDGPRAAPPLPTDPPSARPGDATRLAADVRSAAAEAGADLASFEILEPYGLAPAITLRVDDPAVFLSRRLARFYERVGDDQRLYDGIFVRVVEEGGRFVWDGARANRSGSRGGGGVRPDLAGCDPFPLIGGLTTPEPPPCPA